VTEILVITVIAVGFTATNLVILGLCLKLYTEYFKDMSRSNRKAVK
jgi:multisubunit Na+/H+ antiporter MnhC subunit